MPSCTRERRSGFAGRRLPDGPAGETPARADRTWGMISRSTLIGALVVVELAIIGVAAKAISGDAPAASFNWTNGWSRSSNTVTSRLNKTFVTGAAPRVVLDVDNADVTVQAGVANTVHVDGTMSVSHRHGGVEPALDAMRTTDGVRVAVESGLTYGNVQRQVRITVPPDAQVEVASAASVVANGLRAKFIARLHDGDVRISNHRGDIDVSTSSGDIDLLDAQGTAFMLHADDGAVKLTSSGADHVDARTGSGAISAVDLRAVNGALQSGDGAIDVSFAPESDAVVNLHTSDGSIKGVTATDGTAARSVHLGSGRGQFVISTVDGSITITPGATNHA